MSTGILSTIFVIQIIAYLCGCQTLEKTSTPTATTTKTSEKIQTTNNTSASKNIDSFPKFEGVKEPTHITSEVFITDVSDLNAASMEFRLDFFLLQNWTVDSSYCHKYDQFLKNVDVELKRDEYVIVPSLKITSFWLPDTYLMTAKVTDTQSREILAKTLKIKMEDTFCSMKYTVRWFATISCQLDFRKFPMDIQPCDVSMRSFSYPVSMVRYEWSDNTDSPHSSKGINMLEYDLTMTKSVTTIVMLNETYSVLMLHMSFQRELAYQMLHVYTPSFLIVILAWLSFWMGMNAVPARATLCVTSMLSLVTMFTGNSNRLPPVSYANRMDVWMLGCMIFVFSTLVEFAFVKYLGDKGEPNVTTRTNMTVTGHSMMRIPSYNVTSVNRLMTTRNDLPLTKRLNVWDTKGWTPFENENHQRKPELILVPTTRRIKKIDVYSRAVYLLLFILFNFLYWPILLARV